MRTYFSRVAAAFGALTLLLVVACNPTSFVDVTPTNAAADPAFVKTAAGAEQLYDRAVGQWANAVGGSPAGGAGGSYPGMVPMTGWYTDELMEVQNAKFNNITIYGVDARHDGSIPATLFGTGTTTIGQTLFSYFGSVRNVGHEAREALTLYAPASPPAWRSRMMSAEAYGIIYTAEVFCSGVPLSTLGIDGSINLTRGLTYEEMLNQAVTLFDSAITLAGDSTRFKYLASVGKGRALLDLGKFADAAAAVSAVPTDFVFPLELNVATIMSTNVIGLSPQSFQVKDNEG